jgi:hypothetical protein
MVNEIPLQVLMYTFVRSLQALFTGEKCHSLEAT